jgi:hypothetical protein
MDYLPYVIIAWICLCPPAMLIMGFTLRGYINKNGLPIQANPNWKRNRRGAKSGAPEPEQLYRKMPASALLDED